MEENIKVGDPAVETIGNEQVDRFTTIDFVLASVARSISTLTSLRCRDGTFLETRLEFGDQAFEDAYQNANGRYFSRNRGIN